MSWYSIFVNTKKKRQLLYLAPVFVKGQKQNTLLDNIFVVAQAITTIQFQ